MPYRTIRADMIRPGDFFTASALATYKARPIIGVHQPLRGQPVTIVYLGDNGEPYTLEVDQCYMPFHVWRESWGDDDDNS